MKVKEKITDFLFQLCRIARYQVTMQVTIVIDEQDFMIPSDFLPEKISVIETE